MIIRHEKRAGRPCAHRAYGLSCDEFEALRERAHDRCEICRATAEDSSHGVLHIDHEGPLGDAARVRGLLCGRCNTCLDLDSVVAPERRSAYMANAFHLELAVMRQSPEPDAEWRMQMIAGLELKWQQVIAAMAERDAARADLHSEIRSARAVGMPLAPLMAETGYSRETIRRICKQPA